VSNAMYSQNHLIVDNDGNKVVTNSSHHNRYGVMTKVVTTVSHYITKGVMTKVVTTQGGS
jgi:hypothetical protein